MRTSLPVGWSFVAVAAVAGACRGSGPSSTGPPGGDDAGDDGGVGAGDGATVGIGYPPGAPHVGWFREVPPDLSGIVVTASQVSGAPNGTGIAIGDIDGDGRPDVVAPAATGGTYVYENLGGLRFRDVTASSGVDGHAVASGATLCDLDGDGDLDLLLSTDALTATGNLVYYRNGGQGTFTDVTLTSGLVSVGSARSVLCADLDGDGLLDVYVANYGFIGTAGIPGRADGYFRNRGDGTFFDLATIVGFDSLGFTWTAAASDYDGDGDLDLYVANDTFTQDDGTRPLLPFDAGLGVPLPSDELFRNDGPGANGYPVFTDVTSSAGAVVGMPRSSMGVVAADLTGDGVPDYFVTNYGRKALLAGAPGGTFTDQTAAYGLEAIDRYAGPDGVCGPGEISAQCLLVSWTSAFEDFDLDGNRDLVMISGDLHGGQQPQAVWRGVHAEAGAGAAFTPVQTDLPWMAGRAMVTADLDGDGDVDLVTASFDGPVQVFENLAAGQDAGSSTGWLAVTLKAATSAPEGRGAVVTVGGVSSTVGTGGLSYSSAPAEARFGLGAATSATVDVRWPSGFTSHVGPVPSNQVLAVTEPQLLTVTPRVVLADGLSTASVVVRPAKPDGTMLGSGATVTIDASAGTWLGPVVDVGDGTYTRTLIASLLPALAVVRVAVNGSPITVYPRVEFR